MGQPPPAPAAAPLRWELAAENIVVKVRWFGLFLGYLVANAAGPPAARLPLNAILAVGNVYTLLDTAWSMRGRVFLGRLPLAVSAMEALFIGLLCYTHRGGLDSPFRTYYFLSLICCAIRHRVWVTYATCGLHALSCFALYAALPPTGREPLELATTLLTLVWLTWGATALALLLKRVGEHLGDLNDVLETRIAERTAELHEAQAQLLHQEKMAAFGLLAAGIAHEVGNPLTAISAIVQMLGLRGPDPYTRGKLDLVGGQVARIQGIVRELVTFSRPASTERTRVDVADAIDEALGIAKYYPGTKSRRISRDVAADLPAVAAVRGEVVQVVLNLVLNAVDATAKHGAIAVTAHRHAGGGVRITVADSGPGVPAEQRGRLFQPYFTTKKHGTGLGLFVVRKLVQNQGGRVEYADGRAGGAEFAAWLPAAEE